MENLKELVIEAVAKKELRSGNVANGLLSYIERKRKGGSIKSLVRESGKVDVGLFNHNGEEYEGYWFKYFKKLWSATEIMPFEFAMIATMDDAIDLLVELKEMGFSNDQATSILALEANLMNIGDFAIGTPIDEDRYNEFFAEIIAEMK